jgi:hypothetical protein
MAPLYQLLLFGNILNAIAEVEVKVEAEVKVEVEVEAEVEAEVKIEADVSADIWGETAPPYRNAGGVYIA